MAQPLASIGECTGLCACSGDTVDPLPTSIPTLEISGEAKLPTRWGEFRVIAVGDRDGREHAAVIHGDLAAHDLPLVRVHSECLTGDVLGSLRCDCGAQLEEALQRIAGEKAGVVVYLRQEGRGIGLVNKIKAYELQDDGLDTFEANLHLGFEADARRYNLAGEMLLHLGVKRVRLLTNNPDKVEGLHEAGIEVAERIPLQVGGNPHNEGYLGTKRDRFGHDV